MECSRQTQWSYANIIWIPPLSMLICSVYFRWTSYISHCISSRCWGCVDLWKFTDFGSFWIEQNDTRTIQISFVSVASCTIYWWPFIGMRASSTPFIKGLGLDRPTILYLVKNIQIWPEITGMEWDILLLAGDPRENRRMTVLLWTNTKLVKLRAGN